MARPLYLFSLARSILQEFTDLPLGIFIAQAVAVVIVWAIVYGELFRLAGAIWPLVWMHMVDEPFLNPQFASGQLSGGRR